MNGFAVYYIEANVVCALVFGILLLHNQSSIDRQEKQIKYDHALIAFILYFLADCLWAAIEAEIIPKTRLNVVLNDFLIYFLMAAIIYFWLDFVLAYEQVPHRNRPINRFAVIFPFLVSTVAMILHYLIAPLALIDDALATTGTYNVYLVAVPYIYMAAILFYTIRKARSEESHSEKRRHLFVGLLPLMAIAGGLIQMVLFPYIPIFCFSAMILMLLFYIQSIELRISLDPLTQLNNRGQLARYVAQRSNLYIEDRKTVVIMMDIDGFKAINDAQGHAEGDRALLIVSDALKAAVNNHNTPSFLGRYGGDEFILILHPVALEEADELIREIRDNIRDRAREMSCPMGISAGYDELMGGGDTIQSCIERADKKLSLDKEYRKIKPSRPASA